MGAVRYCIHRPNPPIESRDAQPRLRCWSVGNGKINSVTYGPARPSSVSIRGGVERGVARDDSPFRYGDYWLDRGRNKAVSDRWYIAWYDGAARTVRYRSTRCTNVEDAKYVLIAHVTRTEVIKLQDDEAKVYVAAEIVRYFDEHGVGTLGETKSGVISSICRCFIGFLKQDEVTIRCTFADLRSPVWKRFIAWRRKPHSHSVIWKGKQYDHTSSGVSDTAILKDIKIVIAALNHAVENERASRAPVPTRKIMKTLSVNKGRNRVLTMGELGAIIGYARSDEPLWHYVMLQLATAVRPEAALKFNCDDQFRPAFQLIDLHPTNAPVTQKRNPVVPAIPGIVTMMKDWKGLWITDGTGEFRSLSKRWSTMRCVLGLSENIAAKTIRHTIATMLEWKGCDEKQITRLLGHVGENATTAIYQKYNPNRMGSVKAGLTEIWDEANAAADDWCAKWAVGIGEKGKFVKVDRSTLDFQPDVSTRINLGCHLTEEEQQAREQRRRDGISKARTTRRATKIEADHSAARHLTASQGDGPFAV